MKVLERYKNWLNPDDSFLRVLKNSEAFQYYVDNFELNDDKKKFINWIK